MSKEDIDMNGEPVSQALLGRYVGDYDGDTLPVRCQISFGADANLQLVEKQLRELVQLPNLEFYCAFLTRKQVEMKGLDTSIVNVLDEVLGDRLTYVTEAYDSFEDVMENIDTIRTNLCGITHIHYVLGLPVSKGVADEVNLRTHGKVIMYI